MSYSFDADPDSKITTLYAVVQENQDGNQGILADLREGKWFPLVSSNRDLIHEMRLVAKRIGERFNIKTQIVTFEMHHVEVVHRPTNEENAGASPA
jgi:hypothetical protein